MARIVEEDTICAIASALGEGGIGIIRVSGKQSIEIIQKLFSSKKNLNEVPSHTIHFGKIKDPVTAHTLDEVLVSVFRAPNSYTGEDVVEVSCHGGLATTRSLLKLISASGARLAEPGEFTKRAFLNGKLDLAQAEAVLDVIRAKTDLSLKAALENLEGRLSYRIKKMKDQLVQIAAHLEAYIDFPEADIEVYSQKELMEKLSQVIHSVETMLESFKTGAVLRQGILVVIVGRPNVGKSSLFNALLDRDRAIVSDIAGTTRDTIEELIDLKGIPVRLVDTAGVTETKDKVERMGVERTRQFLKEADFFLFVVDGSESLSEKDEELVKFLNPEKSVLILSKKDLNQKNKISEISTRLKIKTHVQVSTLNKEGLEELENVLFEKMGMGTQEKPDGIISKERHRAALVKTLNALQALEADFKAKKPLELLSLNLREALDGLGELVGEIYTEDILDVIFSEFCIGK